MFMSASKEVHCEYTHNLRLVGIPFDEDNINDCDVHKCDYDQLSRDFSSNQPFEVLTTADCTARSYEGGANATYNDFVDHDLNDEQRDAACRTGGQCIDNVENGMSHVLTRG